MANPVREQQKRTMGIDDQSSADRSHSTFAQLLSVLEEWFKPYRAYMDECGMGGGELCLICRTRAAIANAREETER
jgi:hypothetical protein